MIGRPPSYEASLCIGVASFVEFSFSLRLSAQESVDDASSDATVCARCRACCCMIVPRHLGTASRNRPRSGLLYFERLCASGYYGGYSVAGFVVINLLRLATFFRSSYASLPYLKRLGGTYRGGFHVDLRCCARTPARW